MRYLTSPEDTPGSGSSSLQGYRKGFLKQSRLPSILTVPSATSAKTRAHNLLSVQIVW